MDEATEKTAENNQEENEMVNTTQGENLSVPNDDIQNTDTAPVSDIDEEDDYETISGDESDVEDNVEVQYPPPLRQDNPELPATCTVLKTRNGCKVYLVGTAHFSLESQDDVAKVIQATQPDVVTVELCGSRKNILGYNEEMLLEEAKNINMEKITNSIKQSGVVQGIMHILLLSMSAHLTKELGMAPGGEFRRAYKEARKVPRCRVHLGDRPIQVTLKRALSSLSFWQRIRLAWYLITSKDPISKEDVEKCKQKDMLEQMLEEMTGEFPALSRVFVNERDIYLANSLKTAAEPIQCAEAPGGILPTVVVGVVGIGHMPGIIANWEEDHYDIAEIMHVPEGSLMGTIFKWTLRFTFIGVVTLGCVRFYKWTAPLL